MARTYISLTVEPDDTPVLRCSDRVHADRLDYRLELGGLTVFLGDRDATRAWFADVAAIAGAFELDDLDERTDRDAALADLDDQRFAS